MKTQQAHVVAGIFRHIGELGRLWKAAESYSRSDMLLIRRIIQKQL